MSFTIVTQLQLSLSTLHFLITFLTQIWVCPYLTQIWVEITQHFLECSDALTHTHTHTHTLTSCLRNNMFFCCYLREFCCWDINSHTLV